MVPRAAEQPLAPAGRLSQTRMRKGFVARSVQVGSTRGELTIMRSGVGPGEVVVTEGSFFLRAEMLRNAPAS